MEEDHENERAKQHGKAKKKGSHVGCPSLLQYIVRYAALYRLRSLLLVRSECANHMPVAEMGIEFTSDAGWIRGLTFIRFRIRVILTCARAKEIARPHTLTSGRASEGIRVRGVSFDICIRRINTSSRHSKARPVQVNLPIIDPIALEVINRTGNGVLVCYRNTRSAESRRQTYISRELASTGRFGGIDGSSLPHKQTGCRACICRRALKKCYPSCDSVIPVRHRAISKGPDPIGGRPISFFPLLVASIRTTGSQCRGLRPQPYPWQHQQSA